MVDVIVPIDMTSRSPIQGCCCSMMSPVEVTSETFYIANLYGLVSLKKKKTKSHVKELSWDASGEKKLVQIFISTKLRQRKVYFIFAGLEKSD